MLNKIKFYTIIFCLLGLVTVVSSCKKSKDDPAPTPAAPAPTTTTFAYTENQYQKRWNVSNSQRTSGGTASTLIAVEFTSGVYVLYFPEGVTSTGTYTTAGADTLLLKGLGTLTINTLTDTQMGFTLVIDNSTQVFKSAVATQVIASSAHTERLCKTWKLTSYTLLGTTTNPTDYYVIFNKYGTYLTNYTYMGVTSIGTNTWMWSDSAEESFCYGAWDGANVTDCTGLGKASMTFSSDSKTMTMTAPTDYGDVVYIMVAQ